RHPRPRAPRPALAAPGGRDPAGVPEAAALPAARRVPPPAPRGPHARRYLPSAHRRRRGGVRFLARPAVVLRCGAILPAWQAARLVPETDAPQVNEGRADAERSGLAFVGRL